jgi:hypothetical protein
MMCKNFWDHFIANLINLWIFWFWWVEKNPWASFCHESNFYNHANQLSTFWYRYFSGNGLNSFVFDLNRNQLAGNSSRLKIVSKFTLDSQFCFWIWILQHFLQFFGWLNLVYNNGLAIWVVKHWNCSKHYKTDAQNIEL